MTAVTVGCTEDTDIVLGTVTIDTGNYDRVDTPMRYQCQYSELFGSRALKADEHLVLREQGDNNSEFVAQWQPSARFEWEEGGRGALVWLFKGQTLRNTKRTFDLVIRAGNAPESALSVAHANGKSITVEQGSNPVLKYNYGIVREREGETGPYDRSCYIHPIWTPGGAIVTGDFSPEHIHQRGLFMAWRPVKFGDLETDFWGLGDATGRILTDKAPVVNEGPVFTQLVCDNNGTVSGDTYFKEKLLITVYALPDRAFWLFDITARQVPVNPENPAARPESPLVMELQKLYYGGMSFRGPSSWLREDARDVQRYKARGVDFSGIDWLPEDVFLQIITSEGFTRQNGDKQPARWIDYTGPVGDSWGGAAMFDSPDNLRYPTPVRIHPQLPYYSWAFVQNEPYTIHSDQPLELSYRVLVHDLSPDKTLNEQIAADFAHPPAIQWQRK
jgi:hypothetical protein